MNKQERPTSGAVELTDELIERLAAEAEKGYDVDQVRRGRRRGRPSLGPEPAAVFQVRIDRVVRERLFAVARKFSVSPSELARRALKSYIDLSDVPDSDDPNRSIVTREVSLRDETWTALSPQPGLDQDSLARATTRVDEPLDDNFEGWRQPVLFAGKAA